MKLVNVKGDILKNGKERLILDNVINLYLSLCDNNGKWITNNRVGDAMLKGKISTELYFGETGFNKIYPQDISRTFLDGQVNLVVYAKSINLICS